MNIIMKFNGALIRRREMPLVAIIQFGINIMKKIYKEQVAMTEL